MMLSDGLQVWELVVERERTFLVWVEVWVD